MVKRLDLIYQAVKRCRIYVYTIFITYCISCLIRIVMSHQGNEFALSYRDKIVGHAIKTDNASINYQIGNRFTTAIFDFGGNVF